MKMCSQHRTQLMQTTRAIHSLTSSFFNNKITHQIICSMHKSDSFMVIYLHQALFNLFYVIIAPLLKMSHLPQIQNLRQRLVHLNGSRGKFNRRNTINLLILINCMWNADDVLIKRLFWFMIYIITKAKCHPCRTSCNRDPNTAVDK